MGNTDRKLMTILTILLLVGIGLMFIQQDEKLKTIENKIDGNNSFLGADWDTWKSIGNNIIDDSVYNFQAMRDLFTPMYNDTVTVTPMGYRLTEYNWTTNTVIKPGGWMFWVNHTRELWSYNFEDAYNYLVLFNENTDRIEVIKIN